jgi:hypothetical protein
MKPGDDWTVPQCHMDHARQHQIGELSFWGGEEGLRRVKGLAQLLYINTGNEDEALKLIRVFRNPVRLSA